MSAFRFQQYTPDELRRCGVAFAAAFACGRNGSTADLTESVKQFFFAAAAPDVTVLGCNGWAELMLDQCHVNYPKKQPGQPGMAFWESILGQPISMRLALESEWGALVQVLDDAQKLAFTRAEAKVLLFATKRPSDRVTFVSKIEALRRVTKDHSPWLWIDVPRDAHADCSPVHGLICEP